LRLAGRDQLEITIEAVQHPAETLDELIRRRYTGRD
jgi:hypothetical protein